MTFSGRFLLSMIEFASKSGGSFLSLIAVSGYEQEQLNDEDCRIDSKVYNRVIEACIDETNDPFFGLHAGEYLNLSAAGIIGQITQTSSTVLEAMHYCCEYASLGCRALPMEIKEDENGVYLKIEPDTEWSNQSDLAVEQTIDGLMAFFTREFHLLTLQHFYPQEIGFKRKPPTDRSEYDRVFNCPIKFDQTSNYILFKNEHVNAKIKTSNFKLLRSLVQYAEEQIYQINNQKKYGAIVREAIFKLMNPHLPQIEDVAGNMNTSVRTVQRKLKEENTSYKSILEQIKQELSISYLNNSDYSIKEIAYILGYADTSAFTRSFKRWKGHSPSQYKHQLSN